MFICKEADLDIDMFVSDDFLYFHLIILVATEMEGRTDVCLKKFQYNKKCFKKKKKLSDLFQIKWSKYVAPGTDFFIS